MLKTKRITSPQTCSPHCVFCIVKSTLFHQWVQGVLSSLRQIFPYFSHPIFFRDTSILLSVHPINLSEFKPCPSLVIWTIAIDSLLNPECFLFSSFGIFYILLIPPTTPFFFPDFSSLATSLEKFFLTFLNWLTPSVINYQSAQSFLAHRT